MLRRCVIRAAATTSVGSTATPSGSGSGGATSTSKPSAPPKLSHPAGELPKRGRVSSYVKGTEKKAGKQRFIEHALEKDRNIVDTMRGRTLWESVAAIHWRIGFGFLLIWTWLGYYVIPRFKRWQEQYTPGLPKEISEDLKKEPPPLHKLFTKSPEEIEKVKAEKEKKRIEYDKKRKEAWEIIYALNDGTWTPKPNPRPKYSFRESIPVKENPVK